MTADGILADRSSSRVAKTLYEVPTAEEAAAYAGLKSIDIDVE